MKTVLITGGTRGIGKATAHVFAFHHYNLVLTYQKDKKSAEQTKEEIEKKYPVRVCLIEGNMAREEDIEMIVNESYQQFGTIDCLVNNAAIALDTTFDDKNKTNFLTTLDINLVGPFLLSRLIGNHMQEENKGVIINIASTNGIDTTYPESVDYDASKAGLISLTHNLANYYDGKVRVNAVAPGWVKTEMNALLDSDFIQEEETKILLKRFAEPKEIAEVIYFLASDDASYINDAVIRVDGGVKR